MLAIGYWEGNLEEVTGLGGGALYAEVTSGYLLAVYDSSIGTGTLSGHGEGAGQLTDGVNMCRDGGVGHSISGDIVGSTIQNVAFGGMGVAFGFEGDGFGAFDPDYGGAGGGWSADWMADVSPPCPPGLPDHGTLSGSWRSTGQWSNNLAFLDAIWNTDGDLQVDYRVEIVGEMGSLPRSATVALFWADGGAFENRIGGPFAQFSSSTQGGNHSHTVMKDGIASVPPATATQVLVVIDYHESDGLGGIIEWDESLSSPDINGTDNLGGLSLPDIQVDAAAGLEVSDESDDLTIKYTNSETLSHAPQVALYWASGASPEDIIGDHAFLIAGSAAAGLRTLTVSPGQIAAAPAGATHLILLVDPHLDRLNVANSSELFGGIVELKEDNNFAHLAMEGITSVESEFDDNDDAKLMGKYLKGIQLTNTFTVKLGGFSTAIEVVKYEFAGGGSGTATKLANGDWEFEQDMGLLPAGEVKLTVTGESADGAELDEFVSTLTVIEELDFELSAGPGAVHLDVELLRFLTEVTFAANFTGQLTDLASFYEVTTVQFGSVQVVPTRNGEIITFSHDVATLSSGDTTVFVMIKGTGAGGQTITDPDPEIVFATPVPAWALGQAVFDTQRSQYVLTPEMNEAIIPLPGSGKTPFGGLLDDLFASANNQVMFDLGLVVYADLTFQPDDVNVVADEVGVQAKIAGKTLFSQPLPANITPVLNAKSLQLQSLNVTGNRTFATNEQLFHKRFPQDGEWSVEVPLVNKLITAEAGVSGELGAILNSLAGSMNLVLTPDSNGLLKFDTDSRFIVNAMAQATAGLNLSISANIAGIEFSRAEVNAKIFATVFTSLQVDVSGTLLSPSLALNTTKSQASLKMGYDVKFNASLLGYELANGGVSADSECMALFGLGVDGECPKPSLDAEAGLNLTGPGETQFAGFNGVQPTSGDSMVVLGSTTPASIEPQSLALRASQALAGGTVTPVSSLQLGMPVFSGLESVEFDVNVLADQSSLPPGTHLLQVVLVGGPAEVVLLTEDLSAAPLSANDNPLGFASGWHRLTALVPAGALEFGTPYKLELRLLSDGEAGQQVAVAVDDLQVFGSQPMILVGSPSDDLSDGYLDLQTNGTIATSGLVSLSNLGSVNVEVTSLAFLGNGFELVDAPPGTFTLFPGETFNVAVRAIDPSAATEGVLRVSSNDPNQPTIDIALRQSLVDTFAPTALPDSYLVEEESLTISSPGVLDNDSDLDSTLTVAVLVDGPQHGELIWNGDGSFTYTPDVGFSGPDSFTYRASDGELVSNLATVQLLVAFLNTAPIAVDHEYCLPIGVGTLTVSAAYGLLAGANDLDQDELSAQVVDLPTRGVLQLLSDGSFTYTPGANFAGLDYFTFEVSDGNAISDVRTVMIESQEHAFVRRLYEDVLEREYDQAGLSYWLNQLLGGTARATIVGGFLRSTEYQTKLIDQYFAEFLGRTDRNSPHDSLVDQLDSADGELAALAALLGDDEFFALHGNQNEAFVEALYLQLLGRTAETAGKEFWLDLLNKGRSRAQIVQAILASKEYQGRILNADHAAPTFLGLYQDYLHREPDTAGNAYWLDRLENGLGVRDMRQLFLASDEYFACGDHEEDEQFLPT